MQAVQVREFGGPDVLEVQELPVPEPEAGQVLVRVAAADVMFLDTRLRSGWGTDFFAVQPPYVAGGGIGGTVTAVGPGVDPALLGTRVTSRTVASGVGGGLPIGGYAEQALAGVDQLNRIPDAVTVEQATAVVHDGHTALAAFERAEIRSGQRVLITAAAGGLGTLLTQLAHRAGAQVIAAAQGETKLALTRRLGARIVVDYSETDWTEQVLAATGGKEPDVVFDGAGGDLGDAALRITPAAGLFIGYGAAAGEFAGTAADAARERGVRVLGLYDLSLGNDNRARYATEILDLLATEKLEVVVGQTFPLADAAAAHAAIEARAALGRTLLLV
ncbi:zinc-binding dehydrogenase [Nocardia sp. NBC_01329]|uniref:zinc-binding dehydrogenase n=1 Tax=Nocardia sp. NBC_01329 TaxID=2903594 RepID=UPI002E0E1CAF|nr:zinc-binding dehydrogenase [Nocardia sp. NBC_01329]